jgi:hypothetical protein
VVGDQWFPARRRIVRVLAQRNTDSGTPLADTVWRQAASVVPLGEGQIAVGGASREIGIQMPTGTAPESQFGDGAKILNDRRHVFPVQLPTNLSSIVVIGRSGTLHDSESCRSSSLLQTDRAAELPAECEGRTVDRCQP